jgi:hypothetical protein
MSPLLAAMSTPSGSSAPSADCWSGLPPDLRARSDVAGSGELLWPSEAAEPAVEWLAREGLGVIGGEVYVGVGKAKGVFSADWDTTPQWRADEAWRSFVDRAAEQAVRAIVQPGVDTPASATWYYLAVTSEADYPPFLRVD